MIPTGATGIVLAGGASSRMGEPKASLPLGGSPLIDVVVSRLRKVTGRVVVVAAPGQPLSPAKATVVHDRVGYQGPLSGMRHGLAGAASDACFVTSCDLAFLNRALVAWLIDALEEHDVVVPRWAGRLQPLHAVYRREVLPIVEALLASGERRPAALFPRVRTRVAEEEECRRFDPAGWSFFNINTPADYRRAVEHWRDESACCTVELFGAARVIAQTSEVRVELPPAAVLSDVFDALAVTAPRLARRVVGADGGTLTEGYACSLNGTRPTGSALAAVAPDDHVLIFSADVGG